MTNAALLPDLPPELTSRQDPVLQELWAIKARINQQANYSVAEIVKSLMSKSVDLSKLAQNL